MAAHVDDGAVTLKELAKRNNIPMKFLEQIFLALRNAGVVRSRVGAQGGYHLARLPKEITLGEVIRVLDGTIAPVGCVSQIAYEPCTCPDMETCALRAAMNRVRDAIVGVVDTMSLADALAQAKTRTRRNGRSD